MFKRVRLLVSVLVLMAIPAMVACNKKADIKGKEITVLGPIAGAETPPLEACFKAFEAKTGVKVKYEGTKEFENLIHVRVQGGNPPDVAMFPQPGNVIKFARDNKLIKLNDETAANVKKNYAQGWVDLMTVDGTLYGVVHRVNMKSVVWYPKKAWEKAGWPIPKTWDELKKLCDDMVKKGETPWAVGIESGGATGWVATDWMEDIMLRTAGPEVYDKWVKHEIPFNDPAVVKAGKVMEEMWKTKGYAFGGPNYIATTSFGDAAKILFAKGKPKAWMHRQGNFITNFLPEDIKKNLDQELGVFALPSIDPKYGNPVLGGGDVFVAFKDRPEVAAFLQFMSTGEAAEPWAKLGGALFAYKDQNLAAYPTEIDRNLAKVLMDAKVFRFDGSDMMPSAVGAGTFWSEMTRWVAGKDLEKALADIEKSWPKK